MKTKLMILILGIFLVGVAVAGVGLVLEERVSSGGENIKIAYGEDINITQEDFIGEDNIYVCRIIGSSKTCSLIFDRGNLTQKQIDSLLTSEFEKMKDNENEFMGEVISDYLAREDITKTREVDITLNG